MNKNWSQVSKIRWLFGTLAILFCVILYLYKGSITSRQVIEWTLTALGPLLVITLIYERMIEVCWLELIRQQVMGAIECSPNLLKGFSENYRKGLIKNIISSILEPKSDDIVYSLVEPYLNLSRGICIQFLYTIELNEVDSTWGDISGNDYVIIDEHLQYTKVYRERNGFPHTFGTIEFCSGIDDLDAAYKKEHVIFREKLDVDFKLLNKFNKDQLEAFVLTKMKLQLKINNKTVVCNSIEIKDNMITIDYKILRLRGNITSFEITFQMPQLQKNNHFPVCIIESTLSPKICFACNPKNYSINVIPFMGYNEYNVEHNTSNLCIVSTGNKWVHPRSGAVFIWTKNA